MTIFSRRQVETTLAGLLAVIVGIIGISNRETERALGAKFLTLEKIGNFNDPVYVDQPPAVDALAVVERAGMIKLVRAHEPPVTFLDIRDRVKDDGKGGEEGLLSVAFAPDYAEAGLFYVAFTDNRDDLRIVEYKRSPGDDLRASRSSARDVLLINEPTTKHHGGLLLFGPDGDLFVGSGDGGPSGDPNDVAQNPGQLLGKILRIDPHKRGRRPYSSPSDNPFVGRPGRDEVFALGVRNPWRFSFDAVTGRFIVGDVGQDRFEEVSYVSSTDKLRGANFGWSAYEGFAAYKGGIPEKRTVEPALVYPHGPACSVTAGPFIRDPRLSRISGREIIGRYLYGDFCTGRIFAVRPRADRAGNRRKLRFEVPFLSSFGEDRAGRIYMTSLQGPVYRLDPRRKGS